MTVTLINNPAFLAGLFFLGIIGLSSYLSQLSNIMSLLSLLVCLFSLLSIYFFVEKRNYKIIFVAVCITGLIFDSRGFLCLMAVSSLFYFCFSTKSKWENILWKTSCSLVALTITINVIGYWGMPGTILHIWFWSIPFILSVVLFNYFYYKNRYIFISIMLLCALSLSLNEVGFYINHNESVGIITDSQNQVKTSEGNSFCVIKNISDKGVLIDLKNAGSIISQESSKKKLIISLVTAPTLNPEWLFEHALSGEYYLFAEHNNLTSFIGPNSPFNSDSYQRLGPWILYKPVMNYRLFNASRKDPLYCNNIGCTLKRDLVSYPLVWSYTKFGTPIILAKGVVDRDRRFVFIGDSDPIVSFLVPYNPLWLRSLLGMPDHFRLIEAILVFILSFYAFEFKSKRGRTVVLSILILSFSYLNGQYNDIQPKVDVSISSTGKWFSPHYASHYSNLPKKLANENLTVSVERKKSIATMDIQIVTKKRYRAVSNKSDKKWDIKLYVLLPESSIIMVNRDIISADDVPLGRKVVELKKFQKKLSIEDARTLFINGKNAGEIVSPSDNVYIIGTNSPQRIGGIDDILKKN